MKKRTFLALLLIVAFLLPTVMSSISADTTQTAKALTDSTFLTSGTKLSAWGTPTIDGTLDTEVYKESNKIVSNFKGATDKYPADSSFTIYYANDGDYLYFYLTVVLPSDKTALTDNDVARLYIDFYNTHRKIYNNTDTSKNDYMSTYLAYNTTLYNGGQLQFYGAGKVSGGRGMENKLGTMDTDYKFVANYDDEAKTDIGGYSVEGRIVLPDYVKTAITDGKQPVIGIGYEIRNNTDAPKYYSSYTDNENAISSSVYSTWGDYSVVPSLVLSVADSTKNVTDFSAYYTGRVLKTGETLTAGAKTSGYGTPTIDGTLDTNIYKSYGKVESNTKVLAASVDASYSIYYANDGDYLYFYLNTILPADKTALTANDIARLYIDFYNLHSKVYNSADNEYMNLYLNNNATYHGGQFQYNISAGTVSNARGAANGIGTAGTDCKFVIHYSDEAKTDVNDYVVEGRIKLPNYVKNAIKRGEQPVISIGYEVRNTSDAPKYDYGYADAEIATSLGNGWGDYTLFADLLLSTPATPRTVGFQKSAVVDGKYDIRFTAVIDDYTAFDKAGFVFTYVAGPDTAMVGKTAEVDCWSVYASITADGTTVNATDYGGKYFICFTIKGLTDGQAYTFDVTSRTQAKGMTSWATDKTAQIKITADGNFS